MNYLDEVVTQIRACVKALERHATGQPGDQAKYWARHLKQDAKGLKLLAQMFDEEPRNA